MHDDTYGFPADDGPDFEQQQQLECRRWHEEREAHALAARVARQLLSQARAPWLTANEAQAYRAAAETLLAEAEKRGG